MGATFDLDRFVAAQDDDDTYAHAVEELRRGRKTSHWMWFVFPQIGGLGTSALSRRFAIRSLDEARSYLDHPVLGPRLRACAAVVAGHRSGSARQIFGDLDARKLRSSMTLFLAADPSERAFRDVLDVHFEGERDGATDAAIERSLPPRR